MSATAVTTKSASLVRYDAMCRAIEAAYKVDEVKDIRDQAIALETYARRWFLAGALAQGTRHRGPSYPRIERSGIA
jgi:hypothetical protein